MAKAFGLLGEKVNLPNEDAPLPELMQRLSELTDDFWEQLERQSSQ